MAKKGGTLICIPCGQELVITKSGASYSELWCCGIAMEPAPKASKKKAVTGKTAKKVAKKKTAKKASKKKAPAKKKAAKKASKKKAPAKKKAARKK
jgi:hypothetical protein